MRKTISMMIAAATLGLSPQSGHAAERASASQVNWLKVFEARYQKAAGYAGGWLYTNDFRQGLRRAHLDVVSALQAGDDARLRRALLNFLDLNKAMVLKRADLIASFSHGSGGGGSSNTFASGVSTGASWGTAYARSHADLNPITCVYLFGEEPPSTVAHWKLYREGKLSFWKIGTYLRCSVDKAATVRRAIGSNTLRRSNLGALLW